LSNKLQGKKPMDLSHVKMIVFDEADELFLQESSQKSIV
jgi:superfamily II DNA/RNA helicase